MIYVHTERVNHLKVSWTYREDRLIDAITFTDESELPISRTVIRPKKLHYSLCNNPIDFAISLYKSYYLQKSLEYVCG